MNILFIGEIIGQTGREVVKKVLPGLRKKYKIDVCFANGETITHGKGVTRDKIEDMTLEGVDYFTSGNHYFRFRHFIEDVDSGDIPIIRPANYSSAVPGKGHAVLDLGRKGKVLLVNLQGRIFMPHQIDSPFDAVDEIFRTYKKEKFTAIVVDFHAEATSEKQGMGYYLDGKTSLVVGSHTHIPTADARILPKGTGFVADIGMVGALNSVLGGEIEKIVEQQRWGMLGEFDVASEPPFVFNSIFTEIKAGKAVHIERLDKIIEKL